ncbi:hypothetical protein [Wolbachia endosymbiont of Cantharis cryptica]|uniref:hypothetical protein n=1 Tax=Wolbachia endosymbiont of Cantharis cryptica TaxID=3066132 RepID=UPI00376F4244
MTVEIKAQHSFLQANKEGWSQSEEGVWSTTKGVASANWQYVCHHPYKTTATFVAIAAAISLTAAYFLSPAYATFVGTVGTKAATLVSPAIAAVSAFLVAHPLVASLIIVTSALALIAVPVCALKNGSQASQIDALKEEILKVCEKDGKLKLDPSKLSTYIDEIIAISGLNPEPAKAS